MDNQKLKWSSMLAPASLVLVAAIILLWGLGTTYLWQDEAATAVLAQRMIRFGRPLAYDGENLVTIDYFAAEDEKSADQRTHSAQAAVDYYVRRGDYKPDTTWKWHPWGQFLVAAAGLKLFGATTFGARILFALAGVATIFLFYRFVLVNLHEPKIALLASLFLISNGYWILHSRQCRYYALSSLLLVLTLAAYARWQRGGRWSAATFVLAGWCWFQVDYGTVWPVFGVLFVDALIAERRAFWKPLVVGASLSAAIAPFAYYYELWGRRSVQTGTWVERFQRNIFDLNEYVVPLVVLGVAVYICFSRRKRLDAFEFRLICIACAIIGGFVLWIPAVAPAAFLRYTIILAPVGCLIAAWVLFRTADFLGRSVVWVGAALFIFTPWLGLPLRLLHPESLRHENVIRPELKTLARSVLGTSLIRTGPSSSGSGKTRRRAMRSSSTMKISRSCFICPIQFVAESLPSGSRTIPSGRRTLSCFGSRSTLSTGQPSIENCDAISGPRSICKRRILFAESVLIPCRGTTQRTRLQYLLRDERRKAGIRCASGQGVIFSASSIERTK